MAAAWSCIETNKPAAPVLTAVQVPWYHTDVDWKRAWDTLLARAGYHPVALCGLPLRPLWWFPLPIVCHQIHLHQDVLLASGQALPNRHPARGCGRVHSNAISILQCRPLGPGALHFWQRSTVLGLVAGAALANNDECHLQLVRVALGLLRPLLRVYLLCGQFPGDFNTYSE
jgi:hypothetical protein